MKTLLSTILLAFIVSAGCKSSVTTESVVENTDANTSYIVTQYNGGKVIYTDTFKYPSRDPFNRIDDIHYMKGDTEIQLYQNFVIKSFATK